MFTNSRRVVGQNWVEFCWRSCWMPHIAALFRPSSDVEFFQPSRLKVVAFSYATACAKYKFLLIKSCSRLSESEIWTCTRTTDTQWRHKSKKSENLGRCGRQNMLQPYLKIWEWEWIFGRAVKAISSPGVRSPWTCICWMGSLDCSNVFLLSYFG